MHDIVVIGGGPAGSKIASLLARDYTVRVLEDHACSGKPVQCAGLLSEEAIELSGVSPDILNKICNANIHFPGDKVFSVESDKPIFLAVDREDLDRKMADQAINAGADYSFNDKYLGHTVQTDSIKISSQSGCIDSNVLIGADGHSSKVALSLGNNSPREYVRGIQVDLNHRKDCQDTIEIIIGKNAAPGFFSWEVPMGDITRIGLCTSWEYGPPNEYLKSALKKAGLQDKKVLNKYSGKIPLGGRRITYGERVLLLGDAAGQVKPISGGGIRPALKVAPILKNTVDTAVLNGDFSSRALSIYEKSWKKEIGKELSRGYKIRSLYTRMNDDDFKNIYDTINNDTTRQILNKIHIDRPSEVAPLMLKHPVTGFKFAKIILKAFL